MGGRKRAHHNNKKTMTHKIKVGITNIQTGIEMPYVIVFIECNGIARAKRYAISQVRKHLLEHRLKRLAELVNGEFEQVRQAYNFGEFSLPEEYEISILE